MTTPLFDLRFTEKRRRKGEGFDDKSFIRRRVSVIKVNSVKCRALIDSGSGSSCISAKLVNILKVKPVSTQTKQTSKRTRMEIYQLNTESVIKVDMAELLTIESPHYAELIRDNAHLVLGLLATTRKTSFQYTSS